MSELCRVRWQCRRGLMELEIVLERFLRQHYPSLTDEDRDAFHQLLRYADADLWPLVAGEAEEPVAIKRRIIDLLRRC